MKARIKPSVHLKEAEWVTIDWLRQNVPGSHDHLEGLACGGAYECPEHWLSCPALRDDKVPWYLEVKRSIDTFGFLAPLVVDARKMWFGNGHHRLFAAIDLGMTEVPIYFSEDGDFMSSGISTLPDFIDNKIDRILKSGTHSHN